MEPCRQTKYTMRLITACYIYTNTCTKNFGTCTISTAFWNIKALATLTLIYWKYYVCILPTSCLY